MNTRMLRVNPEKDPSIRKLSFRSIKYFPGFSLRSVWSSQTLTSAECSVEEEYDVVVSNDDGTEVMRHRDAATLLELGDHEYTSQRLDEAMESWNEALRLQPNTAAKAMILANLQMGYLELNCNSPSMFHERDAKRCLDKFRPCVSSWTPSHLSPLLLEYFVDQGQWEGALRLAKLMVVSNEIMARIHYERGIQPSASSALRMECMSKCLEFDPPQRLKLAAHAELVQLYSASENYAAALKHHEERLQLLEHDVDIAKAFFEEGELHLSLGSPEKAMHSLEKGLALFPESLALLEAKADLLFFLGRLEESILLFESILKQTKDPSERTKLLYTMGRICHKSGMQDKAVKYYHQELKLTKETWGEHFLDCSRIYHELAIIADEACDYNLALQHLRDALEIEKLHLSLQTGEQRREVLKLCRGTQTLIGKVYFKTGDFDKALSISFEDLV